MAELKFLFRKDPSFGSCPECGEVYTLKKSKARSIWEKIVRRITFYNVYRCKDCGYRGFKPTLGFTKKSWKAVFVFSVMLVVTMIAVYLIANNVG